MKRIFGLLALAVVLVTPSLASAAGQTGVYVAPKIGYSFVQMNSMKLVAGGTLVNGSAGMGSKDDDAFGGGLAIGYDFYKKFQVPVRTEVEYTAFSQVEGKKSYDGFVAKQKLQPQILFVNAYYDFHNSTAFTPYAGAGLGMAIIDDKGHAAYDDAGGRDSGSTKSKNSTNFAWNVGVGVVYDITDYFSLDLNYRFAGLGSAKTKTAEFTDGYDSLTVHGKTNDIFMHQVMLGLRFSF